jgi:hypothetical protein
MIQIDKNPWFLRLIPFIDKNSTFLKQVPMVFKKQVYQGRQERMSRSYEFRLRFSRQRNYFPIKTDPFVLSENRAAPSYDAVLISYGGRNMGKLIAPFLPLSGFTTKSAERLQKKLPYKVGLKFPCPGALHHIPYFLHGTAGKAVMGKCT